MKNALKNFIQQFCVRVWGLKSVARNSEFTLIAEVKEARRRRWLLWKEQSDSKFKMLNKLWRLNLSRIKKQ